MKKFETYIGKILRFLDIERHDHPPEDNICMTTPLAPIAIIGLGYVGLPLALEFGKIRPVRRLRHQRGAHRRIAGRSGPQGQRSHTPRKQAEQMTAPCDDQHQLELTLAKQELSTNGSTWSRHQRGGHALKIGRLDPMNGWHHRQCVVASTVAGGGLCYSVAFQYSQNRSISGC